MRGIAVTVLLLVAIATLGALTLGSAFPREVYWVSGEELPRAIDLKDGRCLPFRKGYVLPKEYEVIWVDPSWVCPKEKEVK
jgi:hypothetical protein